MWSAFLCYQGYIEFRLDFNLLINYNIKIDFFWYRSFWGVHCTAQRPLWRWTQNPRKFRNAYTRQKFTPPYWRSFSTPLARTVLTFLKLTLHTTMTDKSTSYSSLSCLMFVSARYIKSRQGVEKTKLQEGGSIWWYYWALGQVQEAFDDTIEHWVRYRKHLMILLNTDWVRYMKHLMILLNTDWVRYMGSATGIFLEGRG